MAFSQIVVQAFGAGTKTAYWKCTSDAAFLVYVMTNRNDGIAVEVKSTGAGLGTNAPSFVVGGVAGDEVNINVAGGSATGGFLTLQTAEGATASITVTYAP
jgi:hypothetical protein